MSGETLTKDTQIIDTDRKETPEEVEKRIKIAKKREEKRKRRKISFPKSLSNKH